MARKVILDVDPGIDDAVALCMALFDERLEVEAVTAVAGNVSAEQATRNVQAIIEQLDPPRWPRIGVAVEPSSGPGTASPVDAPRIHGEDGLGNANFAVAELHQRHPADKLISDVVRASPNQVTILTLGPLTNLAMALRRDPALASLVGQVLIMGGAVNVAGNASPVAEFNVHSDTAAAHEFFHAPLSKTLIPLDITEQVVMTYDFLDQLPDESSRAGRFLQRILPFSFRAYHTELGLEGIHLHDAVALAYLLHPELFETELMAGDVETTGELTRGMTVFDRRQRRQWPVNLEVATQIDVAGVKDCLLRGLATSARKG
jgi:purine nucleosidase